MTRGAHLPGPGRAEVADTWTAGGAEGPYGAYGRLRAGRVCRTPVGVLLATYDDCVQLLRAPGTSKAVLPGPFTATSGTSRRERGRTALVDLDPPDHTRLRRLLSSAFTRRRVEALRTRVRELAEGLLDDLEADGVGGEPVDLVGRFAFPLPFAVISELLGMPVDDSDDVRDWSRAMTVLLEPTVTPRQLREAVRASDLMEEHILDAIERRRRAPGGDLLSALVAFHARGEGLSRNELVDQVRLLYLAGHETTVNLIGNGALALLRHPGQLRYLSGTPTLMPGAVDELLRYDSPVQAARRLLVADLDVGGQRLREGEVVFALLGSANRDPERWGSTADELELGRPGVGGHLSFGSGIHHCLGATLARIEGEEAFSALVARFPHMELAGDGPAWNGRLVLRGLESLPVVVAPRRSAPSSGWRAARAWEFRP